MKKKILILQTLALLIYLTSWSQTPKVNLKDMMNFSKNKVDASKIPNNYNFSWKYTMQINTSKNKTMTFDYLLEPNAAYYGTTIVQAKNTMFMILDQKNKISISTFGNGAKKMAMASKIPDYSSMTNPKGGKLTYKSIPGKTILGYQCLGMQASNAECTMTFYYTTKAPVSFNNIFSAQQNSGLPDVFKGLFKSGEKPLLLEMDYQDLKDSKRNTTMKCIELKKENNSFKKADYQFM